LRGIFDVEGLAMKAVLRVDDKPRFACWAVGNDFIDDCREVKTCRFPIDWWESYSNCIMP